jgi:hypothetical protein
LMQPISSACSINLRRVISLLMGLVFLEEGVP